MKIGVKYKVITTIYDSFSYKQSGKIGVYFKRDRTSTLEYFLRFSDGTEWNYKIKDLRKATKLDIALK